MRRNHLRTLGIRRVLACFSVLFILMVIPMAADGAEPTAQASSVNFIAVGTDYMRLSWENGDGTNRLVLIKEGAPVSSAPVDGVSYTASSTFGSGSQIGDGNYVVYNGIGNSVTVTGLNYSTEYHAAVFEFNGLGGSEDYYTIEFDGADDYVNVPNASSHIANGNISISGWVYPTTYPSHQGMFGFRNDTDVDFYLLKLTDTTKLEARFTNSSGQEYTINVDNLLLLNEWHHLAMTYDGSMLRAYHNGTEVGSISVSGAITNTSEPFAIGRAVYGSEGNNFDGNIDEVSLWNKALTPTEIQQIINSQPAGNEPGLVAYYDFDEISGTTLADKTGNGNDGTMTNMKVWSSPNTTSRSTLTHQASSVSFTTIDETSMTVNWKNGIGTNRLVLMRAGEPVSSAPVDGVSYTANSIFGSGDVIGNDNYVVYNGTDSAVTVTGLSQGTTYHAAVFEFNGSGGSEDYYTIEFDGIDDYVEIAYADSLNPSTFTVEALARVQGGSGSWRSVLTSRDDVPRKGYILYASMSDDWQFWIDDNNVWHAIPGLSVVTEQWTHLAGVYDGTNMTFYVDGNLQGSSGAVFSRNIEHPLRIGAGATESETPGFYFNGEIDEVRIWNDARTQTEIQNAKDTTLSGDEAGLMAYYDFDEISGTTLTDKTGNGHNGTMTNMEVWNAPNTGFRAPLSPEPATQASSIHFTPIDATSMTVNWTNGDGSNRIVLMKAGEAVSSTPVDGSSYTASSTFGSGAEIRSGSGNYVVYNGTGSSVTVTGLSQNTTYHVAVFEFNGSGGSENYYTLNFDGIDDYMDVTDDVYFNGDLTVEGWVYVRSYEDWSRLIDFGNGIDSDNVILALSAHTTGRPSFHIYNSERVPVEVRSPTAIPLNTWTHLAATLSGSTGTLYIDGVPVASASGLVIPANVTKTNCFIGRSNWSADAYADAVFDEIRIWDYARTQAQIQNAKDTTLTGNETGLVAYYDFDEISYFAMPDRTSGSHRAGLNNMKYWLQPNTASQKPLSVEPAVQASAINFTPESDTSMTVNWTNGDGTSRIVLMKSGAPVSSAPIDGTGYSSNSTFGIGSEIRSGSGNYVVYNGTGSSVTVTGLNYSTTYHVAVFEFNGSGGTENYYTLRFDGLDDYVEVPSPNSLNPSTFTVEAWARVQGNSGSWRSVLTSKGGSPQGGYVLYASFHDHWHFWINDGSSWQKIYGLPIETGEWTHLAGVYDGSTTTMTFYINGTFAGSLNADLSQNTGYPLRIGVGDTESEPPNYYYFDGEIDEVRIWNDVRTQAEIQGAMNSTLSGSEANLVGYYDFDEISGATLTDKTGSGNDGLMANMKVWGDPNTASSALVMASEPTVQASAVNFTSITDTAMTVNWTNGNGTNRIVLMKAGSAVDAAPADRSGYTADTVFGSGSQIGTGSYVVYNGTGSSVTVTGLIRGTTYHVAVYEFNGSGGLENYLTTTPAVGSETPQIEAQFTAASQSGAEDGGTLNLTIQLSAASSAEISIPFTLSGTALEEADYAVTASPVTIPAGSISGVIAINPVADTRYEPDETVIVTMGTPTNAVAAGITEHTATIANDDPVPALQFTAAAQSGAENGGPMSVTLQLSNPSYLDVTAPFTLSGTATDGIDYTITASPVTIPAGDTSAALTLTPIDDDQYEPDETAVITLGTPTNATASGTVEHIATITNDEPQPPPVIDQGSSVSVTMDEDGSPTAWSPPTLTATDENGDPLTWSLLSGPSFGTATVGGTGASPSTLDYAPNADYNGADSFVVQVSDGAGGTDSITVNVTVQSVNDPPTISGIPDTSVSEGGFYSFAPTATDVEGDPLTFSIINKPVWASFNTADGTLSGTPGDSHVGTISGIEIRVSDGEDSAILPPFDITVSEVNSAPVLDNSGVMALTDILEDAADANNTGTLVADLLAGSSAIDPITDEDADALEGIAVIGADNTNGQWQYDIGAGFTSFPAVAETGGLLLSDGATIRFVPDPDFNGSIDPGITFRAWDLTAGTEGGTGDTTTNGGETAYSTETETAGITVTPVNDAPAFTATDPPGADGDGTSYTHTGWAAFSPGPSDESAQTPTYTVGNISNPDLFAALPSVDETGTLTFRTRDLVEGVSTFDVSVTDSGGVENGGIDTSGIQTFTLTVNGVNVSPTAASDTYILAENTTFNVAAPGVLGNDTDDNGDSLTALLVDGPTIGTLDAFGADGAFTYTPSPFFTGEDTFTYKANDGGLDSGTVTVTLTVTNVADAPAASDDGYSTDEDKPLTVAAPGVLSNDFDAEGDPLTAVKVSDPSNGVLDLFGNDGSFTYIPFADFNGTDSFTYVANDGGLDSPTATVSITVKSLNDAPVAVSDTYSTDEETPLSIAAPGVLENDTDVEGDPLIAQIVNNPANGAVLLNSDGSLTYTPNPGFSGTDAFTYRAYDDSQYASETVSVSVTVFPINDAPVLDNTGAPKLPAILEDVPDAENTGILISKLLASDAAVADMITDPDPNPLEGIAVTAADTAKGQWQYDTGTGFTTFPAVSETAALLLSDGATIRFVPDADANGIIDPGITFRAWDQSAESEGTTADTTGNGGITPFSIDTETAGITIRHVNDAPGFTATDPPAVSEDAGAQSLSGWAVFSPGPGDEAAQVPSYSISGISNSSLFSDLPALDGSGTLTYTPAADQFGASTFAVRVQDSGGTANGGVDISASQTFTITVNAENDIPKAGADAYTLDEDTALDVLAPGLLENDTDPEGDPLTAVLVTEPANGTLTLNSDGSFRYEPKADFVGDDSFTYKANDGEADSEPATVSLTVADVNDPPVILQGDAVSVAMDEDGSPTAWSPPTLTASDADGDPLTWSKAGDPLNGIAEVSGSGTSPAILDYTPNPDFNGTDSFAVTVSDGRGGKYTVTVNIVIAAVNDPPTITGTPGTSVSEGEPYSFVPTAADVDEDILTFSVTGNPPWTTLNPNSGVLSGTPGPSHVGTTTGIEITVADPGGATAALPPFAITVINVNNAPVLDSSGDLALDDIPEDIPNGDNTGSIVADLLAGGSVSDPITDADGDAVEGIAVIGMDDTNGQWQYDTGSGFTTFPILSESHALLLTDGAAIRFVPDPDFNGTVDPGITFRAWDRTAGAEGEGGDTTVNGGSSPYSTGTETALIRVIPVNDAPTAVSDAYTLAEGTRFTVPAPGLLENDTDADGDSLEAIKVSDPANGILEAFGDDGSFTYVPDPDFSGIDTFTYSAGDSSIESAPVEVTLTVTPVADAPFAADDFYSTDEDEPLMVPATEGVLSNDKDAEGDPLTAILLSGPENGTLTLDPEGGFEYKPNANFYGRDRFTYKANDGALDSEPGTVTVDVKSVNDPPVFNPVGDKEGTAGNLISFGVSAADPDLPEDMLTFSLEEGAPAGAEISADGQFSWTPEAAGDYSVSLRVTDTGTPPATDTVTFNIAVAEAPSEDLCPDDPEKTEPGTCGCGVPDTDSDSDGTPDCNDGCPEDPEKREPGICGCGVDDTDSDSDGTPDCNDGCPEDPEKTEPGICGCGVADTDSDGDGTPDCNDGCPEDPAKTEPGDCGCGNPDEDSDGDGVSDCLVQDLCPEDPEKTEPGICGCGVPDTDADGDGTPDCNDECPEDPAKTEPGDCGCGNPDRDENRDGISDCLPVYPPDPPHLLSPEAGAVLTEERILFQASPFFDTDGHSHFSSRWQFREAGKGYGCPNYPAAFDQKIASGDLTRYELTGVHSGKSYFGKVCYTDAMEEETCSEEFSFRAGALQAGESLRIEPGDEAADFDMISFSLTPQNGSAKVLFAGIVGDYDPNYFLIGGYDPVKGGYIQYNEGLKIEPGRAYWFFARAGADINLSGIEVSRNHTIEVPLHYNPGTANGWNMIAPPNGRDYDWNGVEVVVYGDMGETGGECNVTFGPTPVAELGENPYLDTRLWHWEKGVYRSDAQTLSRNRGCWVKTKAANVFLRFPAEGGHMTQRLRIQLKLAQGISWLQDRLQPRAAVADAGDGPPPPPTGFAEAARKAGIDTGAGGCFLKSAAEKD